ncbi:MAG: ABC transporter substrate-binding protein, partial [Alphaproteobacteria bacterium]|nr:ABC transporter substrate-binding protein [Alphaproteobacteria bacterium]
MSYRLVTAAALGLMAVSSPSLAIDVTMYYPVSAGGPIAQAYESLANDFTKANGSINIKPVFAGNQVDALVKAQTAARGGNPPAMAIIDSTNVFTLIEDDMIQPISDFVKSDEEKKLIADIYPAFLANSVVGDKIWSLPFQRSTVIMYYNKEAFKEVGLDPEKPPATWREFADAANSLVKRDAQGKTVRFGIEIPSSQPDVYWPYQAMVTQAGGTMMSPDGKKTFFDSPEHIKALDFWLGLSKSGAMPSGVIAWATVPTDFLAGRTAMMWHTTGNLVRVTTEAKFPVGVAMLPGDARRGTPVGGGNIFIFKGAPQAEKEAAWAFAKWLVSPERAAEFSARTGYVAVRKAAYDVPEMKAYAAKLPSALVARDQLEYAVKALSLFDNARVHKALMDQLQAAINGQATAEAALKKAQGDAQGI